MEDSGKSQLQQERRPLDMLPTEIPPNNRWQRMVLRVAAEPGR